MKIVWLVVWALTWNPGNADRSKCEFSSPISKTEGEFFNSVLIFHNLPSLRNGPFNVTMAALHLKTAMGEWMRSLSPACIADKSVSDKEKESWMIDQWVCLTEWEKRGPCAFAWQWNSRGSSTWGVSLWTYSLDPMSTRSACWILF